MKNKSNTYIVLFIGLLCVSIILYFIGSQFIFTKNKTQKTETVEILSGMGYSDLIEEILEAEDNKDTTSLKKLYCHNNLEYFNQKSVSRSDLIKFYKNTWKTNRTSTNKLLSITKLDSSTYTYITQFNWETQSGQKGEVIDKIMIRFSGGCIKKIKSIK